MENRWRIRMDPKYKDIGDIEIRVIEECSEVIKSLCKIQRFGWFEYHPVTKVHNIDKLNNEIYDLERVLVELKENIKSL